MTTNAPNTQLVPADATHESVTAQVADIVFKRPVEKGWIVGFLVGLFLLNVLLTALGWLFFYGVGVWGINIPVGWGFAIVNFVWWIGIGHAGTLISAILLLLHQEWRTSINRFAEAMTLFAVACAGIFPLVHLGRPQFFYWLFPYPATTNMWPQFRSPLMWDVFAVSTYATVSLLFWYLGLIPDLATMRDRAKSRLVARTYGLFALGWRNSARHWMHYKTTYVMLAALATPLVVSVHTTVSWDFSVGIVSAWHSTVFPPYFVGGAIFCGFAMVLVLAIPLRRIYGLKDLITDKHLDNMAKVMLAAGMTVSYGYLMDASMAWYKNEPYDSYIYTNRFGGPYSAIYWGLIVCNCIVPQLLWFPCFRRQTLCLFGIALVINVGMWLERFVIISLSLHRDYLPSDWAMYYPTVWDWLLYLGTFGIFLTFMLLFLRVLPAISMMEVRELVHESQEQKREAANSR
ncbi:MAG: polysulfide reductase NrfD [Planctomycetaceae bacterium]|nr:polysulfide reductase NrfD [Planctomycetaceae bacterium]